MRDVEVAIQMFTEAAIEYLTAYQLLIAEWAPEEPGPCLIMAEFSYIAVDFFQTSQRDQLKETFELVEELLVQGDELVKDIVATCFLENIINRMPEKISPQELNAFIGVEARRYYQAWNNFTTVDENAE